MSPTDPPEHPAAAPQPPGLREASLGLLEFHMVRERLAARTTFAPAMELALGLTPSYEYAQVARWQEETAEARRILESVGGIDLGGATDVRQALQRAALGGALTGEELRDVGATLKAARGARDAVLRHRDTPALAAMARDLPVLRELEAEIASAIGSSGEVLDTATPTLGELREEALSAYQQLADSLGRTVHRLQRQNILQEPIITQRNGRMVLLVKDEMKHRLPGIVHDVSDSGATVFMEPMPTVRLGNRWRELRLAVGREEERVLRSLSGVVESHSQELLRGMDSLARLDLAMAKARYALDGGATPPSLIAGGSQYMRLVDARHPLLGEEAVPISLTIGDGCPVLVVTGPNAGGKTVALKTAGLLALMAQAGLQLPAKEAVLSLFDGVYADIGDQQSIERSLSTFSSHVANLRDIMGQATGSSLVLIDELGTSTDPEEGAALAKAVLHHFLQQGSFLMATTHQREVAAFVQEQPGMVNASVELDPATLAPTYRLTPGLPGRSYALTIAARLGLDREVVEHAGALLSPSHQKSEGLLAELQEERHLAAQLRLRAEEAPAEADRRSAELEERLAAIENSKARMIEEARHLVQRRAKELARRLQGAERALGRSPAPPLREQVPPTEEPDQPIPSPTIEEARAEVAEVRRDLGAPEWKPRSRREDWMASLRPGDRVLVKGIPRPVEVIVPPDDGGTVEVLLGTMRARLPAYQIEGPARAHTTSSGDAVYYTRASKKGPAKPELDLRGVRVEEALDRVDEFLSDAVIANLSLVRIVHGVGTGALRNAVREYLGHHPVVKSFARPESSATDGVTTVEIE